MHAFRSAVVVTALAAVACHGSLPEPRAAQQPRGAFVQVPYPPPAAHVEFVPARPDDNALWLDGSWIWEGRQWHWEAGGWVHPPPQAGRARWETFRANDGRLLFAPASWRADDGTEVPAPSLIVKAQAAGGGEATSESTQP